MLETNCSHHRSNDLRRLVVLSAFSLVACSEIAEDLQTAPVQRVPSRLELNTQNVSLEAGEATILRATVFDQDGRPFQIPPANVAIAWTTSDPQIVVVEAGVVTALSAGVATVTAISAGVRAASALVVVNARPTPPSGKAQSTIEFRYGKETFRVATLIDTGPAKLLAAEWAAATVDKYANSWRLVAVRPRADGLLDVFEIWRPRVEFGSPYLLVTFYSGMSTDFSSYQTVWSADPMIDAVRFEPADAFRLKGSFATRLYGTSDEFDIEGSFDLPIVLVDEIGVIGYK
ncbi:MAG TPA: hypothetical protein VM939_14640 [Gemmatimonadaceae bacterium]|nr:hypothetical protein [Gemmatimonadaceae bacterium]